jgi:outer membrane protein assembly factor BamB
MLVASMAQSLYAGSKLQAMTTVQYNNAKTGWNPQEETLNIKSVNMNAFGKLWTAKLDGQVYVAPLYVPDMTINGKTHNALYVATEQNLIYALDADTGELLWPAPYSLGVPGSRSLLLCGNINPDIGITGTPVIDLDTNTLYAVGLTRLGSVQVFKMAAVDIETGKSQDGWPVSIDPPSDIPIETRVTSERGALLLANGFVYVPFGGYAGDCGPYHGWVVGVNKDDPTAPQIYYRTPGTDRHKGSGMWAAAGLAADENGNIYPVTGNSFGAPPDEVDFSNAVLRLGPDLSFSEDPKDFFVPSNWRILNPLDQDLGSSAAMILPPQKESNTPNMIFVAGKKGAGHLLNRDNLGGVGTGDGVKGEGLYSALIFNRVYSSAVYYEDAEIGPTLFVAGRGEQPDCGTVNGVVALGLDVDAKTGNSSYHTLWCTPSMGIPMDPLVTSAQDQTGILWVIDRQPGRGVLHAFNVVTGDELYNTDMAKDDQLGPPANFMHFTVINGKVFAGDLNGNVVAYGLKK